MQKRAVGIHFGFVDFIKKEILGYGFVFIIHAAYQPVGLYRLV